MKLAETYSHLNKDLAQVEKALHEAIQADHPVLRKASIQLLQAGGKRIRPVFVLLSGQLGNYNIHSLKTVAVALELIHMATLVHDDVIDDAELRRGEPTIKKLYGNRVAMYAGDYILARALEIITTFKNPNIHDLLSKTLVEVVIGEIEQIKFTYNWEQNLRDYLRRIKRKTALLIATSCKLGALVGGSSKFTAKKAYQYGYYIGMSYQIIDDILDITSTAEKLGKPTGSDLLQGNVTLPILYGMEDKSFNGQLQEIFINPSSVVESDLTDLLAKLEKTNAIERSYQLSNLYLEKALNALNELPSTGAKETLREIATYIGKRRS